MGFGGEEDGKIFPDYIFENNTQIKNDQDLLMKGYSDKEYLSDDEISNLAVEILEKIEDQDEKIVLGEGRSISVKELIEQVKNKEPIGLEYIELFKSLRKTLGKLKDKKNGESKIMSLLGGVVKIVKKYC